MFEGDDLDQLFAEFAVEEWWELKIQKGNNQGPI
jgi:hypothetical protein